MKYLVILILFSLLTSCTNENSLEGKSFFLTNEAVKTTSTVLLQFSGKEYVEVFNIKSITKSNNSYTKIPYRLEGNIFSIQGSSYVMKNNKDGFDLYEGQNLKYKLIANKEDIVTKFLAQPIDKRAK